MRTGRKIAAAVLLCGLTLTGAALPAAAATERAPAPAAAPAAAGQPLLSTDKSVVRSGNTLVMRLEHESEAISWISSEAFVRDRGHPAGADQGLARLVNDRGGRAEAVATIADVPPGIYTIHTRVGGGNGPSTRITVVE